MPETFMGLFFEEAPRLDESSKSSVASRHRILFVPLASVHKDQALGFFSRSAPLDSLAFADGGRLNWGCPSA